MPRRINEASIAGWGARPTMNSCQRCAWGDRDRLVALKKGEEGPRPVFKSPSKSLSRSWLRQLMVCQVMAYSRERSDGDL